MNTLFLGSQKLIDLSGYATESYVNTAVANVDVTDQLSNYVLKDGDKVLSTNDFTDALKTKLEGLSDFDPTDINNAISAIQGTLADITLDGSVNTVIDTWTEIKNFLADYSTANDLKDIIDTVESTVESTVKTWVGNQGYLTANDVSTFANESAITVLDTSVSAIEADYVKSNDVSTFITDNDASVYALKTEIPTVPTTVSSFTNDSGYQTANDVSTFITANDVSTKVTSASVLNIVSISQADYTALTTKDPSTLYIVL